MTKPLVAVMKTLPVGVTRTTPEARITIPELDASPEIRQPGAPSPIPATRAKLAAALAVQAGATLRAMSRVAAKTETIRSTKTAMFRGAPARATP
jgi:hypothetical protein